jgi:mono/diheme cytochrome c family protein
MRIALAACLAIMMAGCNFKNNESGHPIDPALAKILYAGEVVYIEHCASCHRQKPITSFDKKTLIKAHPFDSLKQQDLASVLTYIQNSFGNKRDIVTIEDIKTLK